MEVTVMDNKLEIIFWHNFKKASGGLLWHDFAKWKTADQEWKVLVENLNIKKQTLEDSQQCFFLKKINQIRKFKIKYKKAAFTKSIPALFFIVENSALCSVNLLKTLFHLFFHLSPVVSIKIVVPATLSHLLNRTDTKKNVHSRYQTRVIIAKMRS